MTRPETAATRIRYRLEYALLRMFERGANLPSRAVALTVGAALGRAAGMAGFRRRTVLRNLDAAGMFTAPGERTAFLRRLYAAMGRYAIDVIRSPDTFPTYTVEGEDVLERETKDGRGAVVLVAHLGNWELLAHVFAPKVPMTVIGKRMRNPFVNEWLFARRRASGAELIYPENAIRRCLRALRDGGIAVFLMDQYAGSKGTPAPFFGFQTSTVRTPAGLILKTGCGAIGARALLEPDGTYRIRLEAAPKTPEGAAEDPVAALQEAQNRMLERWVQEAPDHWFGWFHRRFKDCVQY